MLTLKDKLLKCRTDKFSCQFTLDESPRFFIRIDTTKSTKENLIFTHLTFDSGEEAFASEALHQVFIKLLEIEVSIVVHDIASNEVNDLLDKSNIINTYDKIVELIERTLEKINYEITNVALEYRLDRFDIILSTKCRSARGA
jgi:hypothetical protein